jgi:Fe-S-cluster containining protein
MSNPLENELDASAGIEAGDFSAWLRATEALLRSGSGGAEVPCGDCKGCCRSSMFIHIEPAETRTLRRIPRALKFPAPGRPKGHVLMGYSDTGRCPMLAAEQCSIYEDRPQTCRDYDCRVFAATDIPVDPQAQPEIARRVSRWVFRYEDAASCKEQQSLKAVAAFLLKNRDLFPPGSLPNYPVQLAALAVRIHSHFPDWTDALLMGASAGSEAGMVRDLLAALNEARPADSTVD